MDTLIDKAKVPGYHSHECPYCLTRWIHGDENAGNESEHTCPNCGKTMPLTPGTVQSSDGNITWRYGWAKAGVIMPNGQEQRVPVQQPLIVKNQYQHISSILEAVFWFVMVGCAGVILYRTYTKTGGIVLE